MRRSAIVFATAALILVSNFYCQAEDVDLDRIVVTPSRFEEDSDFISRKVDVISKKDIEATQAEDVGEVLTEGTSVDITSVGGPGTQKSVRMRGSTAAQTLVMIDGRPVNSPRDGQVDLSTIPLDNINRIEVMHGPGSSLYGSAGMGGVVNIITKNPPAKGRKTEIYSSFGNNHTFVDRLSHGARLGKFGYMISGGYESSGGFRSNSMFNSKDFNTKFDYKLNDENNLSLNSGFYKSRLGLPGPLSDLDIDNKQVDIKNFIDLGWSFRPDTTLGIKARIYNNHERLEYIPNSIDSVLEIVGPPWGDPITKGVQSTDSRGLDIQFDKLLSDKYLFLCGFNYIWNFNNSSDSGKNSYSVRAWYLENQIDLTQDLKLSLGARLDDYSNFGSQASPSASLAYNLLENLKIRSSVSSSFRAPTFNDLYWPDLGNPNLKPEKGITGEVGAENKFNKYITSGVAYYWSHYTELINWAPDANGIWHPTNIGSATINGIELENKISLTDNLEAGVNYTFMVARDDKLHKFLIYQPQDKVDASLKFNDLKGLLIELKGQFIGRRFNDEGNTTSVKQFLVFGLSASKRIDSRTTWFISMDNLLNRKYQIIFGFPMPGFSLSSGFKFEF